MQAKVKRAYATPSVEQVKLDTEISLVMSSEVPENPGGSGMAPVPQFVQKIFKLDW